MKIDYRKLGKRLKQQRKEQGLTQEKLAEYVNLSVSHLSHIENGNEKYHFRP
ncbi:helix-turn-helix transcriptional regulator [uncultured Anaerofustis sp.]|uniref:helix-turn-helix domain-containing protein n=1 Tax=uncultured Anaerofustis sp. TaxID=904996 RepID=UPI0025EFAAC2|nr:helix-turn-helix transcriptional regulator [uncultured Anaerofustis sp.]